MYDLDKQRKIYSTILVLFILICGGVFTYLLYEPGTRIDWVREKYKEKVNK